MAHDSVSAVSVGDVCVRVRESDTNVDARSPLRRQLGIWMRAQVLQGSAKGVGGAAGRRLLQVEGLEKLDLCVATGNVECIIQLTIAVAKTGAAGSLKCSDKSGMIVRLREAAAKLRMNKVFLFTA